MTHVWTTVSGNAAALSPGSGNWPGVRRTSGADLITNHRDRHGRRRVCRPCSTALAPAGPHKGAAAKTVGATGSPPAAPQAAVEAAVVAAVEVEAPPGRAQRSARLLAEVAEPAEPAAVS